MTIAPNSSVTTSIRPFLALFSARCHCCLDSRAINILSDYLINIHTRHNTFRTCISSYYSYRAGNERHELFTSTVRSDFSNIRECCNFFDLIIWSIRGGGKKKWWQRFAVVSALIREMSHIAPLQAYSKHTEDILNIKQAELCERARVFAAAQLANAYFISDNHMCQ